MNVELTPDQKVFVRQAIENGRIAREEDAVQEALALWEERERRRLEILAMVDEAEASLARGEGREITEDSMRDAGHAGQRTSAPPDRRRTSHPASLMAHRLAPQAEADLDDIAYYVFRETGSIEIAERLIDSITRIGSRCSASIRTPAGIAMTCARASAASRSAAT